MSQYEGGPVEYGDDATTGPRLSGKAIVERARDCYRLASESEAEQRAREKEDLTFQFDQWDERAKAERKGGLINGVETPARPMPTVDQLRHPIQLVYNQFTKAKLGVLLHPVSETASQALADAKQGLYRRIERDSNATQARAWALNRAIKCGRGWYRITTEYDEDGDMEGPGAFDQEIRIRRILYQQNVFMDPAAQEPDCSDGKWLLYIAWKDAEDFRREFPDSKLAKASDGLDWQPFETLEPKWVRNESGKRSVLVAEYWWKEIETQTIEGPDGQKRTRNNVTVYCAKIAGDDEPLVEPYRWPGKYIPFVPVFGEELIPVDTDRRFQGMVRPAMDAQRAFNYGAATLLERAGLEPKSPFIADPKQIAGYEAWWNQANQRNFAVLPYNSIIDGQIVPPPARAQLDTTGMSIAQMLIGMSKDFVQSATAIFDPGLGALPERKDAQSGRAIIALQQQGDAGTGQFMTSMTDVSMRLEALMVVDLEPHVYDREGRVTQILTGEDDNKAVMLGVPFVLNGDKVPVEAPGDPKAETINLAGGKYAVSITVGKNPQTQKAAGEQFMTELIGSYPPAAEFGLDLMFKYRDEPGAKEMADRSKKMIQSKFPFLFDDGKGSPEQAQAELQALKTQMQQLTEQAKAMDEALKTKQVEQQAKIQVAQLDAQLKMQLAQIQAQTELQKAEMDNARAIEVARIQSKTVVYDTAIAAQEERRSTGLKVQAEMAKIGVEHAHEERMAGHEHEHQAAMAVHGAAEEALEPPESPESEGAGADA